MFDTLPGDARTFQTWAWTQIAPYYADLTERPLSPATLTGWLADWTKLSFLLHETGARLHLAHTQDTTNGDAEAAFFRYLDEIRPPAAEAEQALKLKLLASGLSMDGLAVPLRNIRAEADLFRQENLPLLVEESKLGSRYDKLIGAQTVEWEGKEVPLPQLRPVLASANRERRQAAWRKMADRRLDDRAALNDLWRELHALRGRVAANAGHPDYRSYMWQAKQRFDYTPDDCATFHAAIEKVCVPAATRIYERHRQLLGVPTLRPWDLTNGEFSRPADVPGTPPLKPYGDGPELLDKSAAIFDRVDRNLGGQYRTMIREGLLDAENRKGKAPGGYCTYFPVAKRPFIFMNAVGLHDDVQTMLHEAGHAFHAFASSDLPFAPQLEAPMEFNEVASMAMELRRRRTSRPTKAASTTSAARRGRGSSTSRARSSSGPTWPSSTRSSNGPTRTRTAPIPPRATRRGARCGAASSRPSTSTGSRTSRRRAGIASCTFSRCRSATSSTAWPSSARAQVWRNSLDDHPLAVANYRSALRLRRHGDAAAALRDGRRPVRLRRRHARRGGGVDRADGDGARRGGLTAAGHADAPSTRRPPPAAAAPIRHARNKARARTVTTARARVR
ncbi:MAG: M3 family metallopeptidase [Anaerolineae bacterium]